MEFDVILLMTVGLVGMFGQWQWAVAYPIHRRDEWSLVVVVGENWNNGSNGRQSGADVEFELSLVGEHNSRAVVVGRRFDEECYNGNGS